jgi:hypothetical protein
MILNASSLGAKQLLGLLLMATGLLLFCFILFYVAPYGLVAGLISGWAVAILICGGCFLLLNVRVRSSLSSFLAVLALLVGWSFIFFVQLPDNLQFLLASVVALVFVLSYRFFARKSGSHHF